MQMNGESLQKLGDFGVDTCIQILFDMKDFMLDNDCTSYGRKEILKAENAF